MPETVPTPRRADFASDLAYLEAVDRFIAAVRREREDNRREISRIVAARKAAQR